MCTRRCETTPGPIVLSTAVTTTILEANNMNLSPVANVISVLVYTFLGILVFVIAFVVMDKVTPYHLWKEIVQEHNMALAILVGAMSIGLCIIIAAAVHLIEGILLFLTALLIAACGIIYELIAGTLASY